MEKTVTATLKNNFLEVQLQEAVFRLYRVGEYAVIDESECCSSFAIALKPQPLAQSASREGHFTPSQ
ncbi:hypothetical protein PI95_031015 [Hassallia byssoidea VB512170]|uniref:Uncharacterized protein n=1 Tax=Hassallia byssoidea VB512170 TaxID=1304833 RepID=A0A846HL92_9CYAN|nr:hypothetical protein [Hassalia byssoidea]NEU76821.1 hypothetical protein [Hassalia byssoidea VB512170]